MAPPPGELSAKLTERARKPKSKGSAFTTFPLRHRLWRCHLSQRARQGITASMRAFLALPPGELSAQPTERARKLKSKGSAFTTFPLRHRLWRCHLSQRARQGITASMRAFLALLPGELSAQPTERARLLLKMLCLTVFQNRKSRLFECMMSSIFFAAMARTFSFGIFCNSLCSISLPISLVSSEA